MSSDRGGPQRYLVFRPFVVVTPTNTNSVKGQNPSRGERGCTGHGRRMGWSGSGPTFTLGRSLGPGHGTEREMKDFEGGTAPPSPRVVHTGSCVFFLYVCLVCVQSTHSPPDHSTRVLVSRTPHSLFRNYVRPAPRPEGRCERSVVSFSEVEGSGQRSRHFTP